MKKKKGGAKKDAKREYTAQELADIVHDHCERHGGGFFGDFWDGLKKGFSGVMNVAKPILSMIPHPAAQAVSKGMDAFGLGKPKRGRKKAGALTGAGEEDEKDGGACTGAALTGAASTGAALTGAAKKKRGGGSAKRIEIVKKVMKQRGCGMIEASKHVKEKGLYKP